MNSYFYTLFKNNKHASVNRNKIHEFPNNVRVRLTTERHAEFINILQLCKKVLKNGIKKLALCIITHFSYLKSCRNVKSSKYKFIMYHLVH